jgi:hypothetical protein
LLNKQANMNRRYQGVHSTFAQVVCKQLLNRNNSCHLCASTHSCLFHFDVKDLCQKLRTDVEQLLLSAWSCHGGNYGDCKCVGFYDILCLKTHYLLLGSSTSATGTC